jgi:hypothetical protein
MAASPLGFQANPVYAQLLEKLEVGPNLIVGHWEIYESTNLTNTIFKFVNP